MIGCNHTSFEWTRAVRHIYGIIRHMQGLYCTLLPRLCSGKAICQCCQYFSIVSFNYLLFIDLYILIANMFSIIVKCVRIPVIVLPCAQKYTDICILGILFQKIAYLVSISRITALLQTCMKCHMLNFLLRGHILKNSFVSHSDNTRAYCPILQCQWYCASTADPRKSDHDKCWTLLLILF